MQTLLSSHLQPAVPMLAHDMPPIFFPDVVLHTSLFPTGKITLLEPASNFCQQNV